MRLIVLLSLLGLGGARTLSPAPLVVSIPIVRWPRTLPPGGGKARSAVVQAIAAAADLGYVDLDGESSLKAATHPEHGSAAARSRGYAKLLSLARGATHDARTGAVVVTARAQLWLAARSSVRLHTRALLASPGFRVEFEEALSDALEAAGLDLAGRPAASRPAAADVRVLSGGGAGGVLLTQLAIFGIIGLCMLARGAAEENVVQPDFDEGGGEGGGEEGGDGAATAAMLGTGRGYGAVGSGSSAPVGVKGQRQAAVAPPPQQQRPAVVRVQHAPIAYTDDMAGPSVSGDGAGSSSSSSSSSSSARVGVAVAAAAVSAGGGARRGAKAGGPGEVVSSLVYHEDEEDIV